MNRKMNMKFKVLKIQLKVSKLFLSVSKWFEVNGKSLVHVVTVSRADFEQLSPRERMDFALMGGKIRD